MVVGHFSCYRVWSCELPFLNRRTRDYTDDDEMDGRISNFRSLVSQLGLMVEYPVAKAFH